MSEDNFNELIRRHEMGIAYKAITDKMGPSAQLVAFINYDRVTVDSVGLESFDIMDQHAQILSEIEADPAFAMAIESFESKVKAYRGLGVSLAGLIGVFASKGNPVLGTISLATILAGNILAIVDSRDPETTTHATFVEYTKRFNVAAGALNVFASSIPSSLDEKAWETFHANFAKNKDIKDLLSLVKSKVISRSHQQITGASLTDSIDIKKESFSKSGWTAQNFSEAAKWVKTSHDRLELEYHRITNKFENASKLLDKNTKSVGKVPTYMNETLSLTGSITKASAQVLADAEKCLDKIARHFKEK